MTQVGVHHVYHVKVIHELTDQVNLIRKQVLDFFCWFVFLFIFF